MTPNQVIDQAKQLGQQLSLWDDAYYVKNAPLVSDAEYDRALVQLRAIEAAHPDLATFDSPTQKVSGKAASGFAKVRHEVPMLSLYTETDFKAQGAFNFTYRVSEYLVKNKHSERTDRAYCCELKFDGLGVSLHYNNGVLTRAATRGDGEYGEDVTAQVIAISAIPKQLKGEEDFVNPYPQSLEVRGEILMPRSVLRSLNQERRARGQEPYVNARAAAAGSLRLLEPSEVAKRGLIFYAYSVPASSGMHVQTQRNQLRQLKDWGLPVFDVLNVTKEPEDLVSFHQEALAMRESLDFDIDGVVYKVDDLSLQSILGFSGREPRWAAAHKFEPETETTQVQSIDIQVGRTGKLTPVARLIPVFVGGATVSNVTLHNQDEIKRLGIDAGDTVYVRRAGDVIPEITAVSVKAKAGSVYTLPTVCPECGSPVLKAEGEVDYRCTGALICPAQKLASLIHFVNRKAMAIDGLGDKLLEQMVKAGIVCTPVDFYSLGLKDKAAEENTTAEALYSALSFAKRTQLAIQTLCTLDRMGQAVAAKIVSAIHQSKQSTMAKFFFALGIRYAGEGTSKRLAQHFRTFDEIMAASQDELEAIDDIGPTVAKSIVSFFKDERNRSIISSLRHFGVVWPETTSEQPQTNLSLKGVKFVITGSAEGISREDITRALEAQGATVQGSVTNQTHWLIAGEKSGSKLDKAKKLSIPVLNMREFYLSMNDAHWPQSLTKPSV